MVTYQEAYEAALTYYGGDELPAKTFVDKYALRDRAGDYKELTPPEMQRRLAREFYRIEKGYPNPRSLEEIEEALADFRYLVPGGSVMFGLGNSYSLVSLSNCFVINSPEDDMSSIMDCGKDLSNIMKRRGGVGLDLSNLRPEGAAVNNAARTSTGAWSFADLFSLICRMIGQGGRRGALMISMDVRHPDIFKFVQMKRDKKKVTGANVSVRLTDSFIEAVKKDTEFTLQWPVDAKDPVVVRTIRAPSMWCTHSSGSNFRPRSSSTTRRCSSTKEPLLSLTCKYPLLLIFAGNGFLPLASGTPNTEATSDRFGG
jgi:ribonucleoside-diphosphate reductase alpha chain